jgi:PAS domain S-box-containing protein
MEWYIALYIVATFVTSAMLTLLAIYAWRHREAPGATAFAVLLSLVVFWSLSAVLEVLTLGERASQFWYNLKYIGLAGAPPALLAFALSYTGQRRWVTRRTFIALAVIPMITQVMIWTNPWHHVWILPEGGRGVWFWVHTTYSFVLVFIGLTLMGLAILRAPALRRWQVTLLLSGLMVPVGVNILHTFGLIPYIVDLTPIAFTAAMVAFAWTIYRHRLFDLTPLARDVLIDEMQDAVLVLDTDYRLVDHNPAAQGLLGPDIDQALIGQVFPAWAALASHVNPMAATETELPLTASGLAHEHDASAQHIYEVTITPLYDYQQMLAGFLLRLHDITERKRAENAIRQYAHALEVRNAELDARNAELDAFAHTVAHDLKNPLAVLVGFSTLLEARLERMPTEKVYANLTRITQTGNKMTNIIDELLLLASVRKMDEIETGPLDMGAIVVEACDRLADMTARTQGTVVMAETWPVAVGYAPWVEEVWINYLSNALKYGGSPPHVKLGATVSDGQPAGDAHSAFVRFWCRDNGPGLAEDEQALLFTQFTRLHEVRAEGHGLGLSIVRRIVEKLGGTAGVESAPGHGCTFWFTLPRDRKDKQ